MNCAEFHAWLHEFLDGGASGSRLAVEQHDHTCPACRGRLATATRLAEGLQLLRPPAPPARLRGRIAARVLSDVAARRRRRTWTVTVAAAAAVLLAIVSATRWRTTPPSEVRHTITQATAVPGRSPGVGSVRHHVREAGSALAGLVSRTAEEAVNPGRLFIRAKAPSQAAVSVSMRQSTTGRTLRVPWSDAPVKPLREAGETVALAVEPVLDSARRAVQLLAREVPAARQATADDRHETPRR